MESLKELNSQLDTLNLELEQMQDQLSDLQHELNTFELDPNDYADHYDEFLNDIYQVYVNELPISADASTLIAEHDPVAYRCGFSDYLDSLEVSDDDNYKEIEEKIEELEDQIAAKEEEIEELETEITELEDQDHE